MTTENNSQTSPEIMLLEQRVVTARQELDNAEKAVDEARATVPTTGAVQHYLDTTYQRPDKVAREAK